MYIKKRNKNSICTQFYLCGDSYCYIVLIFIDIFLFWLKFDKYTGHFKQRMTCMSVGISSVVQFAVSELNLYRTKVTFAVTQVKV
jgi:hypothetical protein